MLYSLFYISSLLLILPQTVCAQENPAGIGYTYKIIKPKNQIGNAGYFDLRMTPEQKQTVEIEFYNMTDKELSVDLSVNSAKTNSNGVIEYGPTKLKNDPSLVYDMKNIIEVPKKVTLQPKETKNIPVNITMPKEQFDGYISGGIYLQKTETNEEKKADEAEKGVVNKYAFIVGMLLSETDVKVQPELVFNKINAGVTNYRNAFLTNFSNTKATYVEGMTVDVQIFKKGSDEVLYESKKENYRMAPNSAITFPVNLNGESFVAGNYVGHILVTAGDKKWEWQEEFEVTQKEAEKYNAQDVSLVQDRGISWKIIVMIVVGVLGTLLVIYLIIHRISNNKVKKAKKRRRKR
ncbi:hypothetical protein RU98_GL000864 [Enterococcus caccae]|nr:hypothetical protein RU98_GL000864 [Enterococcus caccae]